MYKGVRKYARLIKRHKVIIVGLLVIVVLLLFQVVPVLAAMVQSVVISGTPTFKNASPALVTLLSSGYMDDTGTHATLIGRLDDLSIFPDVDIWFEWGYDGDLSNVEGLQTVSIIGIYTEDIDGFIPTETVNYRFVGENLDGRTYGDILRLQIEQSAFLSGYRIMAQTPLIFTAVGVVGLVWLTLMGFTMVKLVFATAGIYLITSMLPSIQTGLIALVGR